MSGGFGKLRILIVSSLLYSVEGDVGRGSRDRRTDSGTDITRGEGLDGQIRVDLANDLDGVSDGQMGVLGRLSVSETWNHGTSFGRVWGAYAVQEDGDDSIGVDCGLVASQLGDFADDCDDAADEAVEVGGGDAGSGHLLRHDGRLFSAAAAAISVAVSVVSAVSVYLQSLLNRRGVGCTVC